MKNLSIVTTLFLAGIMLTGCDSGQRTDDAKMASAGADTSFLDGLDAPFRKDPNKADDEPNETFFTNLNPFNWFKSEEEKRQEALYAEDKSSGNPLEILAFWNWGKDDPDKPAMTTVTPEDVRSNMSPTRFTLGETEGQFKNRLAHTLDVNTSDLWDDLMELLLLDRPTRASRYPNP